MAGVVFAHSLLSLDCFDLGVRCAREHQGLHLFLGGFCVDVGCTCTGVPIQTIPPA